MKKLLLFFTLFITIYELNAQTITGAWKGKAGNARTEVKIVKKGDSLLGTAYYYNTFRQYRRYAIRGYFDPLTNSVIWWDDELLEDHGLGNKKMPSLTVADFNCPGESEMLLDGNSTTKEDKDRQAGEVHLQKIAQSSFHDEWDFVLANYTVGANHPDIIDSVYAINIRKPEEVYDVKEKPLSPSTIRSNDELYNRSVSVKSPKSVSATNPVANKPGEKDISATKPVASNLINQQKFATRSKKLQTVIPFKNEQIELRFYDNAQIDGDSISLFLNGKAIFEDIRLTDQPFKVLIDAKDLQDDNELVMVAQNLGSIPPNTSFMIAIVGEKRYEARLFANEKSSALIRFIRQ